MTATPAEKLRPQVSPTALTASRLVLRILIVLNWLYGGIIVALLILSVTLGWPRYEPSPENARLIFGMRAVAVLGLFSVPLHLILIRRLLAIVESVRAGDPFVGQNASRLQTIA